MMPSYGSVREAPGLDFIAFYPNQIKSAELVTYDDAGNVIPLSERFSDKDDIMFSIVGNKRQTRDALMATENITIKEEDVLLTDDDVEAYKGYLKSGEGWRTIGRKWAASKLPKKNGVHFSTNKEGGLTHCNIAHRLSYNGEDYICTLVVNEDKQGRRFYDHEFIEIEKVDAPAPGNATGNKPSTKHHPSLSDLVELMSTDNKVTNSSENSNTL